MSENAIDTKQAELQKISLLMELWNRAKDSNVSDSNRSIKEANRTMSDFRNLEFILATFLFTFTSPFFTEKVLRTDTIKLLVFLAWTFILSSIFFGVFHMISDIRFFIDGAKISSKKAKMFSEIGDLNDYIKIMNETNAMNTDLVVQSSNTPLVVQSVLLVIGFLLIMAAATQVLFR